MSKKEIILIDDNKAELKLFKEAIKGINHSRELVFFDSSPAALEYIRENAEKVFIIICDINMPQLTGIELLESINKDHELRLQAMPFIFLSNSAIPAEVEKAYLSAGQGYFQKPYSLDALREIFKMIIRYWSTAQLPRYIHEVNTLDDFEDI